MSVQSFFKVIYCLALTFVVGVVGVFAYPLYSVPAAQAQAAQGGFPLYSWGSNDNGNLGHGEPPGGSNHIPRRIDGGARWIASATSASGAIAVDSLGRIYTWGVDSPQRGLNPALGNRQRSVPTRIEGTSNFESVFAFGNNAAAICSGGNLYTWGGAGVLGRPTPAGQADWQPTRVQPQSGWETASIGGVVIAI